MSASATDPMDSWHLDKRVPVAIIGALALQTLGVGWWAATMQTRQEAHERRIVALEAADAKHMDAAGKAAETLVSIKTMQEAMRGQLDRIERNIDARK